MKINERSPELESAFEFSSFSVPMVLWKCYNHIVVEIFSDTRPEIAALQRRLLRQTGSARKLAMLGQMNQTVKTLALSGLRSRYPGESPEMLRRRLADLVLGPALANLVYGPIADQR